MSSRQEIDNLAGKKNMTISQVRKVGLDFE